MAEQDPEFAIPQVGEPPLPLKLDFKDYPSFDEAQKQRYAESVRQDQIASTGSLELWKSAVQETWMLGPFFSPAHAALFHHEPWQATDEEIRNLTEGVPVSAWPEVLGARSRPQARAIQHEILGRQETMSILHKRFGGATLLGSYLAAGILDPVNLAMMAGTASTYKAIATSGKYALKARFLRTGALAGGEAVTWATGRKLAGDPLMDTGTILKIGAFGAVLGGTFGAVFGKHTIANRVQALDLAEQGATISERSFLSVTRDWGTRGLARQVLHDTEPVLKYRPHRIEANNQRPYGFVSVGGSPTQGTRWIAIEASSEEGFAILQGGYVQYRNKHLTMSGYIAPDGSIRFNADSIKWKGATELGAVPPGTNPRSIEASVNKKFKEFLDDLEATGLQERVALLRERRAQPAVDPNGPLADMHPTGRELDGHGNAHTSMHSAISVEAKVHRMLEDFQALPETTEKWRIGHPLAGLLQDVGPSEARLQFIAIVNDIATRPQGKAYIDSLTDLSDLARLGPKTLLDSDVLTLSRMTKKVKRKKLDLIEHTELVDSLYPVAPAVQHFDGAVLKAARAASVDPNTAVHLVYMTPEQFGSLTIPLKAGTLGQKGQSVESLVELLEGGAKLDELPFLEIVNEARPKGQPSRAGAFEVSAHDGRHRAQAFERMGIEEIPVLIRGGAGSSGLTGSSLMPLTVDVLRNERGFGKKAFQGIEQIDHPFPLKQIPDGPAIETISSQLDALRPKIVISKSTGEAAPAPLTKGYFEAMKAPSNKQRGAAEAAMSKIQQHTGGGSVSYMVEHAGDLINRISGGPAATAFKGPKGPVETSAGWHMVGSKIRESYNEFRSAVARGENYDDIFRAELRENYTYNVKNKPGFVKKWPTFEAFSAEADRLLEQYAKHHRELLHESVSEGQRVSQEAVLAIAEKRWDDALKHLKVLNDKVEDRDIWSKWALSPRTDVAPKAPRRIATEYTVTLHDTAVKLLRNEWGVTTPVQQEIRITARTKAEGTNSMGGKYTMHYQGEELDLFARNKAELTIAIHSEISSRNLNLAGRMSDAYKEVIGPELPKVPPLLLMRQRSIFPDELSDLSFYQTRGQNLTHGHIQILLGSTDSAIRPFGEVFPMYHGTTTLYEGVPSPQLGHGGNVFVSPNEGWARGWAEGRGSGDVRVIEMIATPKKIFDPINPAHVREVLEDHIARGYRRAAYRQQQLLKLEPEAKPRKHKLEEGEAPFFPEGDMTVRKINMRGIEAELVQLRELEVMLGDDVALAKHGRNNFSDFVSVEQLHDALQRRGYDAAFEIESWSGKIAWNLALFDPKNQLILASKAQSLMPKELVAVKQVFLEQVDLLETVIDQVEKVHPKYAMTPEWRGFLDSVVVLRDTSTRPKWQRAHTADDIIIDVPLIGKKRGEGQWGVDPATGKRVSVDPVTGERVTLEGVLVYGPKYEDAGPRMTAKMAGRESLERGDRLLGIGDSVFVYNQRTGLNVTLEDIVATLHNKLDDVVAETARQENKFFNRQNMEAFRGAAAKQFDRDSIDVEAPFASGGVHAPTLGGSGTNLWNSLKTQLGNTKSDAVNWVSLHITGNQAGAETRAGKIVSVVEDTDSFLRHGVAIDRSNFGVTMAAEARRVITETLPQWKKAVKTTFADDFTRRSRKQFRKQITKYIRDPELLNANPATLSEGDRLVQQSAKAYSDMYKNTIKWLRKNDPDGPWKDIPDNPNYFPRMWSETGHGRLSKEFSPEQVLHLVAESIRKGSLGSDKPISASQATRFAELYLRKVGSSKFRLSWLDHPSMVARDPKKFMAMLQSELGIAEEEAARFTALFSTRVKDGTHAKYRIKLDENVSIKMTAADGHSRNVSFDELLNNDVVGVTDKYLHSVFSTAAEREVVRLFSDKLGIPPGVFKSWDDIGPHLLEDLAKKGTKHHEAEAIHDALRRELRGTPFSDSIEFAQNGRILRDANYSLGAGATFGVAAFGDAFNAVFAHGIRNALQSMGIMRAMVKGQKLDISDDIKFMLEASAIGDNKLRAMRLNPAGDDLSDLAITGGNLAEFTRQAATTMSDVSGINAVTKHAEGLALRIHMMKYINMMLKGETPNSTRLAQIGYDAETWARDAASMQRNVRRHISADGVETIQPNFREWNDQNAVRRFIGAIESEVTSHVIRADMNDLPRFFHRNGFSMAMGQLILQFRNFGITATRAMLVRNIKANDARAYITFLTAAAGGALVYIMKQHIRFGDSPEDKKKFAEAMSWDNLVTGAILNSAYGASTEIPDAIHAMFTGDNMIGHRYAPSERLFGDIPTGRTADAIFKSLSATLQGDELTDSDRRAIRDISVIGRHPVFKLGEQVLDL